MNSDPIRILPDLSDEEFHRFAAMVFNKTGITLKDAKKTMLSNRLRRRVAALNLESFAAYYAYMKGTGAHVDVEWVHFVEAVTTNETYFWRAFQQMEMIRDEIVPILLKRFPKQLLRLWSAACSTGEEPYNLGIELVESMKTSGFYEFQIIASDISHRVIQTAREAKYSGRKIEKVPPLILRRYFREHAGEEGVFEVRQDIKDKVTFRVENIFEAVPPPLHLILCRNVMIYFRREEQDKLVNHFLEVLQPGGFLIVGHAESLQVGDSGFRSFRGRTGTAYEKPLPVG